MRVSSPSLATGRTNSVIQARKLQQRKFRRETGEFLLDGPQAVREGLASGISKIFVDPQVGHPAVADLVWQAQSQQIPVIYTDTAAMRSLSDTEHPQGIVGVCRIPKVSLDDAITAARQSRERFPVVVLLNQVSDPGNAGTIIRSADAAGASAVLLSQGSVDPFNSKVVRSSAGSLLHLPVLPELPFTSTVAQLRAAGFQILGTTGAGEQSLFDTGLDLTRPTVWVLGNEAHGLPDTHLKEMTARVRIPLYGLSESLNVGMAATLCLYESARQFAAKRTE